MTMTALTTDILEAFKTLTLPRTNSHKGENGKMVFIGGSSLFHAPVKWSLDTASRFVDMLFYSSVPQNQVLIQEAKKNFWNGIVVPQGALTEYILEADVILIGPGMERNRETQEQVTALLTQFPQKKWVVDAGALQMVKPELLTETMIITPHSKELERLASHTKLSIEDTVEYLLSRGVGVLLKGASDTLYFGDETYTITGGHPGMTKGGTGDVLAGIVAGLYATNSAKTAALVASYSNKKAGEELAKVVGPFFNASDLALQLPKTLFSIIKSL